MQRTDKASYRVACPQLKRKRTNWNINSCTKVQEQLPTPPLHHPLPPIYVSSNGGCLIKNSRFPISVLLSYEISSQVNRKGYDKIHRNCKEREKQNLIETGRPRAICGQRYPLPCFEWLWIRVRGSRAAAPKGTKSCRTQGDFRSSCLKKWMRC